MNNDMKSSESIEPFKGMASEYRKPEIVELGEVETLTRSQSYGAQLDGDSDQQFRHKPA